MDIRVLRYFVTVAREGSITGAANFLHITQPTLSRQLKELEEELGKKLFTRSSYSVSLTDEGMILRRRAEDILDMVDKTKLEFLTMDDVMGGDIHIGGAETVAMNHIGEAIRTIQKDYPSIRYHIQSGNAEDISERLDKGLLDFGIMVDPIDLAKYTRMPLPSRDVWGLITRKEHPLAHNKTISVDDLVGIPLICSRRIFSKSIDKSGFLAWFGDKVDKLTIAGTYNLVFNASILVKQGVGCALAFDKLVNTGEDSDLCFVPLHPEITAGVSIVWKRYQVFSPVAKIFLKELEARFKDSSIE